jgi:hypothetical protein
MKKSTESETAVMFPDICQPYASSEIEMGMSRPAAVKFDRMLLM